jgi:hypothetical protein
MGTNEEFAQKKTLHWAKTAKVRTLGRYLDRAEWGKEKKKKLNNIYN